MQNYILTIITFLPAAGALVRKGGSIVLIGVAGTGEPVAVPALDVVLRQLNIKGSFLGNCHPQRDMPRYLDYYRQGRLDLDGMISRRGKLEDVNEAFRAMKAGEVARTVLMFD